MRARSTLLLSVAFAALVFAGCDDDPSSPASDATIAGDTVAGDGTIAGDATDPDGSGDATTTGDATATTAPGDVTSSDVPTDTTVPGACAPLAQTGCMASERCVLDQNGAAACTATPAMPKATGEECLSGECDAGDQCVTIDGLSTCRSICDLVNGSGCGMDEACTIRSAGGGPLGYCGEPLNMSCDLLEQTGCGMGEGCIAARDSSTGEFVKRCFPAGEAGAGEACGNGVGNCAPKHICLSVTSNGMTSMQCVQYCDESLDDADCPMGSSCVDGAAIGLEGDEAGVGICR